MSKTKEKQLVPKWFDGEIYKEGSTVRNPFSGEECELNSVELSIYDFVVGANRVLEEAYDKSVEPNDRMRKIYDDLHLGLDWFKEHNAKAYMVLLD